MGGTPPNSVGSPQPSLGRGPFSQFHEMCFWRDQSRILRHGNRQLGLETSIIQTRSDRGNAPTQKCRRIAFFSGDDYSYLRQFVKKYSIIAAPLTDLLRNKDFASKKARKLPVPWGTPQEESFQNLKQELASPLVLAFPDWNIPYILQTDANTVGADAVLIQSMKDEEGIISCASHRFSRTDSLRGPTQRECMAVLWAIKHFSQNVADRRFTLVTDCSALTWLFRSRNLDPKLHRWALCLQKYEIELKWRAGCTHLVPDCLLRLPTTKPLLEDVDDSFRDDTSSLSPPNILTPTGPVFEGVALQDLAPYEVSTTQTLEQFEAISPAATEVRICILQQLPFATCAVLESEPPLVGRSGRKRTLSVRLRTPGYDVEVGLYLDILF